MGMMSWNKPSSTVRENGEVVIIYPVELWKTNAKQCKIKRKTENIWESSGPSENLNDGGFWMYLNSSKWVSNTLSSTTSQSMAISRTWPGLGLLYGTLDRFFHKHNPVGWGSFKTLCVFPKSWITYSPPVNVYLAMKFHGFPSIFSIYKS